MYNKYTVILFILCSIYSADINLPIGISQWKTRHKCSPGPKELSITGMWPNESLTKGGYEPKLQKKTFLKGFWPSALVWNAPPNGIIYRNDLLSCYPDGHMAQSQHCQLCTSCHVFSSNKCHSASVSDVHTYPICVPGRLHSKGRGGENLCSLCPFCVPKTLLFPRRKKEPQLKDQGHLPPFAFLMC